ncbi:transposase [Candidatus Hamiltonella defensa]|uniref:Transposase n=1 Tax=Candidatus Williamhamiltonella defendens TaxID=138072 RepID=A0A4P2SRK9_9ENTR|nr:transposase [Candidatus Hamiltonella defensa]ASV33868.1 transposase [Candidatus Hamiltonella defensa]ASV34479.1 transposase [Candidatus Hamiltonella defensa]AWK16829.1 transposase [Candidatus Hamiltonella defensa]AWK17435.1 transposase [Candidatus Hamiltonella defensa]MBK4361710.1 transposase [Candidatus Hamiltonella defensa]
MGGHKCTKDLYRAFLQASSMRYSGLALSEVSPLPLSHDSISRWLKSRCFRPKELWELVAPCVDKARPCLLIADDTVLAKTRSKKIEGVHYQYSGNQHDVIAGIGLVNLLWYDLKTTESVPVDYRIYDKDTDGKTKNTHFCEMLNLAKDRGMTPEAVVMDAWYSSLDNLKTLRSHGWVWVTTLRKNRIVNCSSRLESLDIPEEGLLVHLRGYGWVTVFKFVAQHGRIDYVASNMIEPTRDKVTAVIEARWSVEVYHREVKQTCGIERCQARTGRAQRNHIFLAISAWFEQYKRRVSQKMSFYQQKWQVIKTAISDYMRFLLSLPH